MQKLQGDFPAVPEILGNLVPHQVNPWIGAAPEGADHLTRKCFCEALQSNDCACAWSIV